MLGKETAAGVSHLPESPRRFVPVTAIRRGKRPQCRHVGLAHTRSMGRKPGHMRLATHPTTVKGPGPATPAVSCFRTNQETSWRRTDRMCERLEQPLGTRTGLVWSRTRPVKIVPSPTVNQGIPQHPYLALRNLGGSLGSNSAMYSRSHRKDSSVMESERLAIVGDAVRTPQRLNLVLGPRRVVHQPFGRLAPISNVDAPYYSRPPA
jgi:hypothetical protein